MDNSDNINETPYNKLWKEIHKQIKVTAETFVPKLYDALIKEGYLKEDARKKIKEDAHPIWKPETIDEWIPKEAKQEIKVLAGQQSGIVRSESVRSKSNRNDITKTEIIPTIPKSNDNYSEIVRIKLSQDDCREIKSGSILSGREFNYDLTRKKVVKWF